MNQPSTNPPVIVWIRQDLRLADHPALWHAVDSGAPVLLVFILPDRGSELFPGAASCWWLHHSLTDFQQRLNKYDQKLILRQGDPTTILPDLVSKTSAQAVFWNTRYEPEEIEREQSVASVLKHEGVETKIFPGNQLIDPAELLTKSGDPYQVFTPFWKACRERGQFAEPLPAPKTIPAPADFPASESLEDWKLLPKIPWDTGMQEAWTPGEEAASKLLKDFLKKSVGGYRENRNLPAISGTSRLSPYLHFGEISPRTINHQTIAQIEKFEQQDQQEQIENAEVFLSEIAWREFACSILFHFPHTVKEPLRDQFRDFTWTRNSKWLKAWQRGKTGFPIVDAGMRELWHTGWMHNRVRMIVASFLTKDLQIHWLEGANWFMDTLVDADLASNTLGWQWTAGCGADAAPYFRIFNPVLQSEKFDAKGIYIRQWCPELAKLPDRWIHKPDQAPPNVLRDAGVQLGETYPKPIVDHSEQRKLALERYDNIRNVSK